MLVIYMLLLILWKPEFKEPVTEHTCSEIVRGQHRLFCLENVGFLWSPQNIKGKKKHPEEETVLESSCLSRLSKTFPKPRGGSQMLCKVRQPSALMWSRGALHTWGQQGMQNSHKLLALHALHQPPWANPGGDTHKGKTPEYL